MALTPPAGGSSSLRGADAGAKSAPNAALRIPTSDLIDGSTDRYGEGPPLAHFAQRATPRDDLRRGAVPEPDPLEVPTITGGEVLGARIGEGESDTAMPAWRVPSDDTDKLRLRQNSGSEVTARRMPDRAEPPNAGQRAVRRDGQRVVDTSDLALAEPPFRSGRLGESHPRGAGDQNERTVAGNLDLLDGSAALEEPLPGQRSEGRKLGSSQPDLGHGVPVPPSEPDDTRVAARGELAGFVPPRRGGRPAEPARPPATPVPNAILALASAAPPAPPPPPAAARGAPAPGGARPGRPQPDDPTVRPAPSAPQSPRMGPGPALPGSLRPVPTPLAPGSASASRADARAPGSLRAPAPPPAALRPPAPPPGSLRPPAPPPGSLRPPAPPPGSLRTPAPEGSRRAAPAAPAALPPLNTLGELDATKPAGVQLEGRSLPLQFGDFGEPRAEATKPRPIPAVKHDLDRLDGLPPEARPPDEATASDQEVGPTITLQLAGGLRRLAALVLDAAIVGLLAMGLSAFGLIGPEIRPRTLLHPDAAAAALAAAGDLIRPVVALLVLTLAVSALSHALAGRTLGKLLLGLELVNVRDGRRPGPVRATIRAVLSMIGIVLMGAGYLWLFVDRRARALHDRLAGTVVVVSRSRRESPAPAPSAGGLARSAP